MGNEPDNQPQQAMGHICFQSSIWLSGRLSTFIHSLDIPLPKIMHELKLLICEMVEKSLPRTYHFMAFQNQYNHTAMPDSVLNELSLI